MMEPFNELSEWICAAGMSFLAFLKKNKKQKKNVCPPGAALGRLLGEGVAHVTPSQKWDMRLNPGGYALVGRYRKINIL